MALIDLQTTGADACAAGRRERHVRHGADGGAASHQVVPATRTRVRVLPHARAVVALPAAAAHAADGAAAAHGRVAAGRVLPQLAALVVAVAQLAAGDHHRRDAPQGLAISSQHDHARASLPGHGAKVPEYAR